MRTPSTRLRLLVSVANVADAEAALAGGADIIDAKEPAAGPLGAVSRETLCAIWTAVAGRRLVTAALGDAADEADTERAASAFAAAGAAFVKVGFSGIGDQRRVEALLAAAVRGTRSGGDGSSVVVAVAYADADRVGSLGAHACVHSAVGAGASGILLDTADKKGPGLRGLLAPAVLTSWVRDAHDAGLIVALAGKLSPDDLSFVRDAGADIAGVRGAACEGGRTGRISSARVATLRNLCGPASSLAPEQSLAGPLAQR